MSGVGGLDDSDYFDPSIKTFAWWQAASRNNDGEDPDFEAGCVISDCSLGSSQEEGVSAQASLVPVKRVMDVEHIEGPLAIASERRKRRKVETVYDTDALFGQWL